MKFGNPSWNTSRFVFRKFRIHAGIGVRMEFSGNWLEMPKEKRDKLTEAMAILEEMAANYTPPPKPQSRKAEQSSERAK
jgi:hypothetical protein